MEQQATNNDVMISILPLAHMFQRIGEVWINLINLLFSLSLFILVFVVTHWRPYRTRPSSRHELKSNNCNHFYIQNRRRFFVKEEKRSTIQAIYNSWLRKLSLYNRPCCWVNESSWLFFVVVKLWYLYIFLSKYSCTSSTESYPWCNL